MLEKFYIFTSGCKINQYESQALKEAWARQGLAEVKRPEDADFIFLNTCAVTDRAVQDVRKYARRFMRINQRAKILIAGCAAQIFGPEFYQLPGVVSVIPQDKKAGLVDLSCLAQSLEQGTIFSYGKNVSRSFPGFEISDFFRARPVIKVQDGCSQCCTYCIVPLTRGPSKSRAKEEILAEAKRLLQNGFQEIVLSGINLRQYKDQGFDFWDLVTWLDERIFAGWGTKARFRLSSLDPCLLQEKGIEALKKCRLICPHLHISVQSASKKILDRMGRGHYSPDEVIDFSKRINEIWPYFGLGADFLVGFPGEKEEDFKQVIDFCQEMPFSYGHVFTFSARPGTRAGEIKDKVQEKVKKERSKRLRALLKEKKLDFLKKLSRLNSLEVILEQEDPALGICEYYALCSLREQPEGLCRGQKLRLRPCDFDPLREQLQVTVLN